MHKDAYRGYWLTRIRTVSQAQNDYFSVESVAWSNRDIMGSKMLVAYLPSILCGSNFFLTIYLGLQRVNFYLKSQVLKSQHDLIWLVKKRLYVCGRRWKSKFTFTFTLEEFTFDKTESFSKIENIVEETDCQTLYSNDHPIIIVLKQGNVYNCQ